MHHFNKFKVAPKIKFVSGTEENLKRKIRREIETSDLEQSPKTMVKSILKLGPKTRNTEILKKHPSFVYRCGSAVLNERQLQAVDPIEDMEVDSPNDSNAMDVESPNDPTALPMEIIPGLDSSPSTDSSLASLPTRRQSSSSSDFNGESMEMFCFEHLRPEAENIARSPENIAESEDTPEVEEMEVDNNDDGFDALDNNIHLIGSLDESTLEAEVEIDNMLAKYQ